VTIDSTVLHERLAWDAHCNGVHAYHAWAFEKRDGGVYVLTEEMQNGWLARQAAGERSIAASGSGESLLSHLRMCSSP
jgi:hypothetical protein